MGEKRKIKGLHRIPRQCLNVMVTALLGACGDRLVGRYPGWQRYLHRLPRHLFQGVQWLMDDGGAMKAPSA